jgi:hypothetical protein
MSGLTQEQVACVFAEGYGDGARGIFRPRLSGRAHYCAGHAAGLRSAREAIQAYVEAMAKAARDRMAMAADMVGLRPEEKRL